jgi:glycosyltransferase involved in cell wall biosynthesis
MTQVVDSLAPRIEPMGKKRKKPIQRQVLVGGTPYPSNLHSFESEYGRACHFAEQGKLANARNCYALLLKAACDTGLKARIQNDLGTLKFLEGDRNGAKAEFEIALRADSRCEVAKTNLAFLDAVSKQDLLVSAPEVPSTSHESPIRVAILSFLFNWPSTGGGNVHTFELAIFLKRAGFEVQHWYVRHPPWGIGNVPDPLPFPSEGLEFTEATWNAAGIQNRFRECVEAFHADHVIITDSWNFKPLLAEAVAGFPYIMRMQALECLCPLNNIRLLPKEGGGVRQCQLHQLATPNECSKCIAERGGQSGFLHQAERALSGVGTPEYHTTLVRAFQNAEAVLVVNPLSEAMISPYSSNVRVVTAGMDPGRFPWPDPVPRKTGGKVKLLFAGLVDELMKGFDILLQACSLLWHKRQDFELLATADPPGQANEFTRFVGWLSQEDLPAQLQACDILMMPTIAQEALGRTAVEGMAAGRPVIASRLGGLPFTVIDGATGLLCEPGDPHDLARKIETLLDDPELRHRLGQAGRKRFEEHDAWPVIIERHYIDGDHTVPCPGPVGCR